MPDWLLHSFSNGQELHLEVLLYRLVVAGLLGGAVAGVYWLTHRRDDSLQASFVATLVLLAILIAMVTQVIGDNVARAFSLVGALSIVRFRTVVEDTRDTAFVIFAVIIGMAVGADRIDVALVGLLVVSAAAVLLKACRTNANPESPACVLTVRLGLGRSADEVLAPRLREFAGDVVLLSAATARQGTALELTYRLHLRPSASLAQLAAELNRLEGVQGVELKRG